MLASVFIATMDPADPTRLTSDPVRIVAPEYAWDNTIAEGPNVLAHDGRLYLIYSGSTVGDTYTTGLATASAGEGADLTDPGAWSKLNYPIQHSGMYNGHWQLGTGHGMWSQDEDGNLLYVFHASTDHNGLSGRDTFVRRVHFAADGLPVLDMELEEEVAPANSTVTVQVTVTPGDEPTTTVLSRCVAGDVVLLTRPHNPAHTPVSVELGTPFGSASAEIAPGRASSRAFSTRTTAIPAGEVTLTSRSGSGSGESTRTSSVPYDAANCG